MTNCSEIDLKGYLLGETEGAERERISSHIALCPACREEMERLQLTQMALGALREEEPPRRIAFVSDKIFEPRWWQRWLAPVPVTAFASAVLVAAAILAHGEMVRRSAPPAVAAMSPAQIEQQLQQNFDRRLQAAITKAVADVRAQDRKESAQLLESAGKQFSEQRRMDLASFELNYENLYKRMALDHKITYSALQTGPAAGGVTQ